MFTSSFWPPESVAIVAAVLLLAGFVKGVVGLGLPTVSLGLLTAVFGLKAAIALMLVPSFATNVVQGLTGGALKEILGQPGSCLRLPVWRSGCHRHCLPAAIRPSSLPFSGCRCVSMAG